MSTSIRREDNGVIIVEPHGKLVGTEIIVFQNAISPEIKAFDVPLILINLEHTTAMSSSGLSALVQAYRSVQQKNGRIGIIHIGKHIKNLLVLSRLSSLFEHFESEAEAVSELSV